MERAMYIKKYRNIGLKESEKIVLNHSLRKGEMGNLVIVVGANNSGKSNVLDALLSFSNGGLQERDITTLSYEDKDRKPKLTLINKDGDSEYSCELDKEGYFTISYPKNKTAHNYIFYKDLISFKECILALRQFVLNYSRNSLLPSINSILKLLENKNPINEIKDQTIELMEMIEDDPNHLRMWRDFSNNYRNYDFVKDFSYINSSRDVIKEINEVYMQNYSMKFLPKILKYEDKKISNSNLSCQIGNIKNNNFIFTVLETIGITTEEVTNTYNAFKTLNNKGALTTLQRKVNKKLSKLSDDFNRLYFEEEATYKFEMSFESSMIFFEMFRGNRDISLDYQSTGFKWFFNLYFNLLCKNSLESGDVIIMDEPATNLHVQGQLELRKFLKDFAVKNDLTIVLATHSPFLIDLDYLDELRVITNKDNLSSIDNDFTTIDINDPDSLKPIKTALTVNNHILFDPDKLVVFVEGITDYNYLLAFKKVLKIDFNIVFLPIKGVGNIKESGYKEKQLEISKRLIEIKKHQPVLLVDGDGAGKSIQSINKDNSELVVYTLTDIDPTFKTIESVFAEEDIISLNLKDTKGRYIKHSSTSALIKTFSNDYQFNQITLNNFKKIFDFLKNVLD